jgi:8-oxo-dGTP diphosphatase
MSGALAAPMSPALGYDGDDLTSWQMIQIAQVLLFDRDLKLLIYLRDDTPRIPFPNHWDLFGGHVEAGETPEQALCRELREEIGVTLEAWRLFHRYECLSGDVYPNTKFIYFAEIDCRAADLTLYEGQKLTSISATDRFAYKFANILGSVVEDFIAAGLWPGAVDNFRGRKPD